MNNSANRVAEAVGAVLEGEDSAGEGSTLLSGVAAPDRAGLSDLIYVEAAAQAPKAVASAAVCVIAPPGVDLPGKTILRSAQPKVAFAKAAALLRGEQPIARGIHPTAIVAVNAKLGSGVGLGPYVVVEEDAEIGAGTEIGAHAVIGPGCRIGAGCRLHPRVTLYAGVRIGQRVEIHSGAVIGADGFGYAFDGRSYTKFPQAGIVEIADDVEIGANSAIDRGSLGDTRIGEGVKLDNLVHVAHNVEIGAHTVIAAQTGISGSCKIGHHVVMAGQVGLGDHCTLENGAIIGGQAGILPGKVVRGGQPQWGTPARPLDKFKEMYVWFARLPELVRRIQALEKASGSGQRL